MMRRVLVSFASAALLAGYSTAALAQATTNDEPRELNFEVDVIKTSSLEPDGGLIEGESTKPGGSLLKIRHAFVPEIVESADDI